MTNVPLSTDTLLWLGAADAKELDEFAAGHQGKLILVEADEVYQPALVKRLSDWPQLELIIQAVAETSGLASFYRYNLNELNALAPATGFKQIFPGLRLESELQVNTVSVVELVTQLALDNQGVHRLVLTLPAQALALLTVLADQQLLQQFSRLSIQIGVEVLYQGAATAAELVTWLSGQGYDQIIMAAQDLDLPVLHFQKNALKCEFEQVQQRNTELLHEQQKLQQQNIQLQQLLDTERQKQAIQQQQAADAELLLVRQLKTLGSDKNDLQLQFDKLQQQFSVQELASQADQAELHQQLQLLTEKNSVLEQQVLEKNTHQTLSTERCATLEQQLEQQAQENSRQKQDLTDYCSTIEGKFQQATQQLQLATSQQAALKTQLEQSEKTRLDLQQQLEKTKVEVANTSKHAGNRLEKINQLEKENRLLQDTNQQLNARQQQLEKEMLKAEAQIDIIKELILKD